MILSGTISTISIIFMIGLGNQDISYCQVTADSDMTTRQILLTTLIAAVREFGISENTEVSKSNSFMITPVKHSSSILL